MTGRRLQIFFTALPLLAVAALPSRAGNTAIDARTSGAPPLQIYAPTPLADAFRALAVEGACPHTELPELLLADSATLVAQIERGARADVIATADADTIERLVASGRVLSPQRFATTAPPQARVYWIAPLHDAPRPLAAAAFVERVLSAPGKALLQRHGFAPVSE